MRVAYSLVLLALLTAQCKKSDLRTDVAEKPGMDALAPSPGLDASPSGLAKPRPDVSDEAEQALDTVLSVNMRDAADAPSSPGELTSSSSDAVAAADVSAASPDATALAQNAVAGDVQEDVSAAPTPLQLPAATDASGPQIVFDRFQAHIKEAEFTQATHLLEEWLKLAPKDGINRQNLARTYLQMGQFEPAVTHLAVLTSDKPQDGELWAHYARSLAKLNRYTQANEAFKKAFEATPDDIDLCLDYARTLSKSGRYSEATAALESVVKLNVRKDEVLAELAAALALSGQYPKALDVYQQLQQMKPTVETAVALAQLAYKFERCDDAVGALTPFETRFADEVPYLILSDCLAKRGEHQAAAVWLQKAVAKTPTCLECELSLGDALANQKLYSQADPHYRKVIELKPSDFRGHFQLGKVLGLQGRHKEAAEALSQANDRNPNFPDILEAWGTELALSNQTQQGWKVWGQMKDLDPDAAARLKTLLER